MPIAEIHGYTRTTRNSACSICNTSQRTLHRSIPERVFTTGINIDFEGDFDICEQCLREAAALLGCLLPEQADELEAENNALNDSVRDMSEKISALEAAVDALSDARIAPKPKPKPKPRKAPAKAKAEAAVSGE